MKALFLLVFGFSIAAKIVAADPSPTFDPAVVYVEAFRLIQDGERAVTRADFAAAWAWFTAAQELLTILKQQAPDWHSQMVDVRLRYCAAHLAEIASKRPQKPADLNVVLTAPLTKRDNADLSLSARDLTPLDTAVVPKPEAERTAAQAAAAEAPRQAEELAAQNRTLSKQLAQTTRRSRRPDESTIPELRNHGFIFRRQPAPVAAAPSLSENAALRAELQRTRAELAASREVAKEVEYVKRENRELRDQIADLRKQLTAARQQQASAPRIAEWVRENTALKLQIANPLTSAGAPELPTWGAEVQPAQTPVAQPHPQNSDPVTTIPQRNQEFQTSLADPAATAWLEREWRTTQATLTRLEHQHQSQVAQLQQRNAELSRQIATFQQAAANLPPVGDRAELARLRRELSLAKTEVTLLNRAADRADRLAKENAVLKVELAKIKLQREPIDQRRLREELNRLQEIAMKNTELIQRLRQENAFLKNLLENHTARNPELKGQLRRLTPRQ